MDSYEENKKRKEGAKIQPCAVVEYRRAQRRRKLEPKKTCTPKITCTHFLRNHHQKITQHPTTAKNGQIATVRRLPPWWIFAITWPKIMLENFQSNQNTSQEPARNLNKRRGAAQRFDCLLASLPDRSCFLPSISLSAWILMMIWWMMLFLKIQLLVDLNIFWMHGRWFLVFTSPKAWYNNQPNDHNFHSVLASSSSIHLVTTSNSMQPCQLYHHHLILPAVTPICSVNTMKLMVTLLMDRKAQQQFCLVNLMEHNHYLKWQLDWPMANSNWMMPSLPSSTVMQQP